jgi:hypothetical protein
MTKQNNKMTLLRAVDIVEGDIEVAEEEYIGAWQHLIDSGQAWTLQGWYGRVASSMIQQGVCYYPVKEQPKKPVNTGGQTPQTPEEK